MIATSTLRIDLRALRSPTSTRKYEGANADPMPTIEMIHTQRSPPEVEPPSNRRVKKAKLATPRPKRIERGPEVLNLVVAGSLTIQLSWRKRELKKYAANATIANPNTRAFLPFGGIPSYSGPAV